MTYHFEHIKNGTLEEGSTLIIINDHLADVSTSTGAALCERNGGKPQPHKAAKPAKPAEKESN